ncbi:MAG: GNAT family N-acetyltransferase [Streptosporangiaceae bacterium]|nr:GNAT family N-acetyltransferase [Streptosporangiaceae bacterium]
MDPDQLECRELREGDDMVAVMELMQQGFGGSAIRTGRRAVPAPSTSRGEWILAAFDQGRPVGTAVMRDMTQWWGGAPVPMCGTSGLSIAPEYRRLGVGRRLFSHVQQEGLARGYPLLSGYPMSPPFFRSLGWEMVGRRFQTEISIQSLRSITAPKVRLRRAGPPDASQVRTLIADVHREQRDSGPVLFDPDATRIMLATPGLYNYLADDGFLSYHWNGTKEIIVQRLLARSEATLRAMWAMVASYATQAHTVRAWLAPNDPITWLLADADDRLTGTHIWGVRITDAPTAMAARGFPGSRPIRVPLLIEDTVIPANSGRWTLVVADGKGALEPDDGSVGPSPLTLTAGGLAALYGGIPLPLLRRTGLARGGDVEGDPALDALFATQPHTFDSW